jgi:inosine triphosphate pyrophosphatase
MNKARILFVSSNKNKVNEINRILKNSSTFFIEHHQLDLPEIQGEPLQISLEKCKTAWVEISCLTGYTGMFTEDVSLCFNALNGLPGPYIKHFLKNLGHNNLYKLLDGFEDKSAYALCTYTYLDFTKNKFISTFGKVNGKIVKPKGSNNFGWDCVFQPDGSDVTFGEMTLEQKDSCSHRAKALEKLIKLF